MSDISKQIVALLVTKDLYKAKLLISESLNQKIGLLLEEKLISYAPTIHSSNLFEQGTPAVDPTLERQTVDAGGKNPHLKKKDPYITAPTYWDMARQFLDGSAIKFGTQLMKFGLPGKIVGGGLVVAGGLDAAWQAGNTVKQLADNTRAEAAAIQQDLAISKRINNERGKLTIGVNDADLSNQGSNKNYTVPFGTAVKQAGLNLTSQAINMITGSTIAGRGLQLRASAAEQAEAAEVVATARGNIATTIATTRAPVPVTDLPRHYNVAISDFYIKPFGNKFIGSTKQSVVDRVAQAAAEEIRLAGARRRADTPEVTKAIEDVYLGRTNYGTSEQTARDQMMAAAKMSGNADVDVTAILPQGAKQVSKIATAAGVGKNTGLGVGIGIQLLPNWQQEFTDMMHPPQTAEQAQAIINSASDIFARKNSSNSNVFQDNSEFVRQASEDRRTGKDVITSASGMRQYAQNQ